MIIIYNISKRIEEQPKDKQKKKKFKFLSFCLKNQMKLNK